MAAYVHTAPLFDTRIQQRQSAYDRLALFLAAGWWLVIFQGAIRKWLIHATVLYLIQDVPLAIAYFYAFWKSLVPRTTMVIMTLVLCCVLTMQALVQMVALDNSLVATLVGLHHYLFYLPVLAIYPVCLRPELLRSFLRANILFVIPNGPLAYWQSVAGPSAWINATSGGIDTAFNVPGTHLVRASGTFNFTMPYSIWCGFAMALVVGEWLQEPSKRLIQKPWMLYAASLSAIIGTMVSGSRSATMQAAAALFGGFVSTVLLGNRKLMARFLLITALLPIAVGVAYLVNPVIFSANLARFSGSSTGAAEDSSDVQGRLTEGVTGAFTIDTTVLGYGIGRGIQAANALSSSDAKDMMSASLAEIDTERIVQEMGRVTGTILALIRYGGVVALILLATRVVRSRKFGSSYAMPLAVTMAPELAFGDMTRVAPECAPFVYYSIAIILAVNLYRRDSFPENTEFHSTRSM